MSGVSISVVWRRVLLSELIGIRAAGLSNGERPPFDWQTSYRRSISPNRTLYGLSEV